MDAILSLAVTKLVNQILRTDSDNDPANEITAEDVARINRAGSPGFTAAGLGLRPINARRDLRSLGESSQDAAVQYMVVVLGSRVGLGLGNLCHGHRRVVVNKEQIELITAVLGAAAGDCFWVPCPICGAG